MTSKPTTARRGGNVFVGPIALAVLVWVGGLKDSPLLSWLPVDATLVLTVIVAVAIADSWLRGGRPTRAVWGTYGVFVLLLPAALIAPGATPYADNKVAVLFTITLLLAIAPFFLLRAREQRNVFIVTLAVIGLVVTAIMIMSPTAVVNSPGRVTLEGTNTILTSRMILAGATISIIAATARDLKSGYRVVFVIVGVAQFAVAVLTGSRGPLVSALAAIVGVVIVARAYRTYRVRAIVGLLIVGVFGAWFAISRPESEGLIRIIETLTGDEGQSGEARIAIWEDAFARIASNALGTGWGSFQLNSFFPYPHNILLEIGVEAGLIVLAIVIALLVATTVRGARAATDWQGVVILCLFLYAFFNALVSSDINGNRLLIVASFAIWALPHPVSRPNTSDLKEAPQAARPRTRLTT